MGTLGLARGDARPATKKKFPLRHSFTMAKGEGMEIRRTSRPRQSLRTKGGSGRLAAAFYRRMGMITATKSLPPTGVMTPGLCSSMMPKFTWSLSMTDRASFR